MKSRYLGAIAAVILSATQASAAVLFEHYPINGTVAAYTISDGIATSTSFTLATNSIVTGVNFGSWTDPFQGANPITTIDFGITATPNVSAYTGTVAVTNSAPFGAGYGFNFYNVYESSFSTGNIALAAGTYYLVLQNAATAGGQAYWDTDNSNSNPGTQFPSGAVITGLTFQILGEPNQGSVPEPSTWAMIILGFAGVGAMAYRRSRKDQGAALAA
jgi:hypothetical protein